MKNFWMFVSGFCLSSWAWMALVIYSSPISKNKIMLSTSFEIDGKEWQCGYTSRQVEINLLEDKIKKLKGE